MAQVVLTGKQSGLFGHRVWLHFKSRQHEVMQMFWKCRGWGMTRMQSSSSQMNTVGTAGPLQWADPAALSNLFLSYSNSWNASLLLIAPSKGREQQRQRSNSMKAQLNNMNFNPGISTIAQGLELLPNLLRVHHFPSGSSSLLSVNFIISFSWITLPSPSSPGKFPKIKQLNSV